MPILAKRGWSIHEWAVNSDVDFHTANGYLKGETNPFRSTRKKLAESLGIKVEELPQ
jgi:transcriptional regulator with XRE-family HTH domain